MDADAHKDNNISGSCVAIDRDRPQFESPVTRTCNQSHSVEEEARVRSWVVNLNPLLPLVVVFYQGERGGVEVEAWWQRSKNGGERQE
jgi:hypothetical protein